MKRLVLSLFLVFAATTMIAEEFTIGKLTFTTISPTNVELSYADKSVTQLYLNPTVTYNGRTYNLVQIGLGAFMDCKDLSAITIPSSVQCIRVDAFGGTALYNNPANWTNGVLYINNCLIEADENIVGDYRIKANTRLIADNAFQSCSYLSSVTIPGGVKVIPNGMFYDCTSLTSVDIPNGVTRIGEFNSLEILDHSNGVFDGCTSLRYISIPNDVRIIGDAAFKSCHSLRSITIPSSVTHIGNWAFAFCEGLTSFTLPNSVTKIGVDPFCDCSSLTSPVYNAHYFAYMPPSYRGAYTIPIGIKQIVDGAFYECTGLTTVTIPNSVTSIGWGAFMGCIGLTSVTIPNSVTSIGDWVFDGCTGLTSPVYNAHCFAYMPSTYRGAYTIPSGIKQIAGSAFEDCTGLTSISIPSSVTTIGAWAFHGCKGLTSVTIPNSVTRLGEGAFSGCEKLSFVSISNRLTILDYETFASCSSLTKVIIPEGVTEIRGFGLDYSGAFDHCTSLMYVSIPRSMKSIEYEAFLGCESLTSVSVPAHTEIEEDAFPEHTKIIRK